MILKSGAPAQPLDGLHCSLNRPASTVLVGIDREKILDPVFEATRTFSPVGADPVAALVGKTGTCAADGEFELCKPSQRLDSTAEHLDGLGGSSESVRRLAPTGG